MRHKKRERRCSLERRIARLEYTIESLREQMFRLECTRLPDLGGPTALVNRIERYTAVSE